MPRGINKSYHAAKIQHKMENHNRVVTRASTAPHAQGMVSKRCQVQIEYGCMEKATEHILRQYTASGKLEYLTSDEEFVMAENLKCVLI